MPECSAEEESITGWNNRLSDADPTALLRRPILAPPIPKKPQVHLARNKYLSTKPPSLLRMQPRIPSRAQGQSVFNHTFLNRNYQIEPQEEPRLKAATFYLDQYNKINNHSNKPLKKSANQTFYMKFYQPATPCHTQQDRPINKFSPRSLYSSTAYKAYQIKHQWLKRMGDQQNKVVNQDKRIRETKTGRKNTRVDKDEGVFVPYREMSRRLVTQ